MQSLQLTRTAAQIKFIYSEKATKFCEISTVDLTVTTQDKTMEISQKFVAFTEYMNFKVFHLVHVMTLLNKLRLMLSCSIVLRHRLNSKFTREPLIYYVRIFLSFLDPLILKVNIFFCSLQVHT